MACKKHVPKELPNGGHYILELQDLEPGEMHMLYTLRPPFQEPKRKIVGRVRVCAECKLLYWDEA